MADTKISALSQLSDPASLDEFAVVDKSDTTQAASGSTKRITMTALREAAAFDQRSGFTSTVVLPGSTDLGIQERLAVGTGSVEISPTSTLTVQDVPAQGSKITTVNKAAVQSVPNTTVTVVSWDFERDDSPGWWAAGNPTYIQPTEAGVYMVCVQTQWADNSTANRSIHVQLNGTVTGTWGADGAIVAGNPVSTARFEQGQSITWVGRLAAGDKITVWVYQSTGGALNFGGLNRPAASSANAEFSVIKLGT